MSEETTDHSLRSQAGEDDARLDARMKEIMERQPARPARGRANPAQPSANPDWLKAKKAKPAPAKPAEKPARPVKKKTTSARPPKNSEESWKLAAEYIARQQADE